MSYVVCDMETFVNGKEPVILQVFDTLQEAETFREETIETVIGIYRQLYGGADDSGAEKDPQPFRTETENRYQVLTHDDYQNEQTYADRVPKYVIQNGIHMINTKTVRRFVLIDNNYDVVDRFDTYREAWEYMQTYPTCYAENMLEGDDYGHRSIDAAEAYEQAQELLGNMTIVYDKGDDDFIDLPDEKIMLDAIGVDTATRQQYEHYNDWLYENRHLLWLDELEDARRADS